MDDDLRVLTVRQPWAWAIVHGGKDVENRSRATRHRGPLLIHAGQALEHDAYGVVARLATRLPPAPDQLERGAIIGVVDVVGCVEDSDSPWADEGLWHWLLANPRAIDPPVPAVGKLGLWKPPPGTWP